METPFVEPGTLNIAQLSFVTVVYAVVLYQASGLISGGSELLMLVPSVAGIVGSIVLPILGAVPDGMMVLFSGVGPNAQETVSVGVGALAGSTVMLLTLPWFVGIMFGRVPLADDGNPDYSLRSNVGLFGGGVAISKTIKKNTKIMLITTALYCIIQVPASRQEWRGDIFQLQVTGEHMWALIGLAACIFAFTGYLVYCFMDATEDKQLAQLIKGIQRKQVTIAAALEYVTSSGQPTGEKDQALLGKEQARLKKICRPFYKMFDFNKDNSLTREELKPVLFHMGLYPSDESLNKLLDDQDKNHDGKVSFEEFVEYLHRFMMDPNKMSHAPNYRSPKYTPKAEIEEDPEDFPEDLARLSPSQQMTRVIFRSIWMMALGTLLVLIFSDPMVDCLSEWGTRLQISPFYVSFTLAPFASNASELLSAYTYAKKKTEKSITTSFSTLVGAACMNNTFVLGIFLALIYIQGLAWQFTAETIAMVLIQWIIGFLALVLKKQTVLTAIFIILCYPGCLGIVWFLENIVGLD